MLTPYQLVGTLLPMEILRHHQSKAKLLNAALNVIRAKGYAATTIDDLCREAGLTKGSFFHHFKSKGDLVLSAVSHWGTTTEAIFRFRRLSPIERPFGAPARIRRFSRRDFAWRVV